LRNQNREFLVRTITRRPFVILKLAATLDGRIADSTGRSKWITSPAARRYTRGLRRQVDAIMVGAGTAAADNPGLNGPGAGKGPLKVVVDSAGRIRPGAKLFRRGRVLVATTTRAPHHRLALLAERGATVMVLPARHGRVELRSLLQRLLAVGVGSIYCEGGAELAGALVSERLVDRVLMVLSPQVLGGRDSRSAVGGPNQPLFKSLKLAPPTITQVGPDTVFDALCGVAAKV
jgi:diaminohydroxyphosphoribosylaminopyrimidine deaminase/5-amino-6-(5-phosphoribosylamino)uracil reductase